MQNVHSEDLTEDQIDRRITEFTRTWEDAGRRYAEHLKSIKSILPHSMQEFANVSLHDGEIISAQYTSDNQVVIQIEGQGYWGPSYHLHSDMIESAKADLVHTDVAAIRLPPLGKSVVNLVFQEVEEVEGIDHILGDWWLYEEVHCAPFSGFEYCVLFMHTDFRIIAKELEWTYRVPDHEFRLGPGNA
jgi:hypothetical protein